MHGERRRASYRRMEDGTKEDYAIVTALGAEYRAAMADRLLAYLETRRGEGRGFQVDEYEHALQTATRAMRDGADDETIVAALFHDIGDGLAFDNHAAMAAAVLQPFVLAETAWMLAHHDVFQGYHWFHHIGADRNAREKWRGHPSFAKTAAFCARWDQASFDASYDTFSIAAFEPAVRRIFSRRPWSIAKPDAAIWRAPE
jgi:predicted HD phosphohydrolase